MVVFIYSTLYPIWREYQIQSVCLCVCLCFKRFLSTFSWTYEAKIWWINRLYSHLNPPISSYWSGTRNSVYVTCSFLVIKWRHKGSNCMSKRIMVEINPTWTFLFSYNHKSNALLTELLSRSSLFALRCLVTLHFEIFSPLKDLRQWSRRIYSTKVLKVFPIFLHCRRTMPSSPITLLNNHLNVRAHSWLCPFFSTQGT